MTKKEKQFVEDMKRCRGIDFARVWMTVEVEGHPGTITGMASSANMEVQFADQSKFGRRSRSCHSTYRIRYFGKDGKVFREYGA